MSLRDKRGFSLIELAIVVLIGGLVLAITTPSINTYLVKARLRDSASRFAGEMRLARQRAVSNNSRSWFWTWNGSNYYYIGEQRWQGATSWGTTVWRGPYYLPSTVKVLDASWANLNYFWYTPDGRPMSSGSVRLVSTSGAPDTVQVNVDLSGSVWQ
jgi:prepilin-type N-terminal cleavage/methylation domain-containing protein